MNYYIICAPSSSYLFVSFLKIKVIMEIGFSHKWGALDCEDIRWFISFITYERTLKFSFYSHTVGIHSTPVELVAYTLRLGYRSKGLLCWQMPQPRFKKIHEGSCCLGRSPVIKASSPFIMRLGVCCYTMSFLTLIFFIR